MSDPVHTCARCGARDGATVYRRRRDGAWFDGERRAWRTIDGKEQPADPRNVTENPQWLESVGRVRQLRTRLQLDGVCFACAQRLARAKMDGAA